MDRTRILDTFDALLSDLDDEEDDDALSYVIKVNGFLRPGQAGGEPA